jgi:hypothetical protein
VWDAHDIAQRRHDPQNVMAKSKVGDSHNCICIWNGNVTFIWDANADIGTTSTHIASFVEA